MSKIFDIDQYIHFYVDTVKIWLSELYDCRRNLYSTTEISSSLIYAVGQTHRDCRRNCMSTRITLTIWTHNVLCIVLDGSTVDSVHLLTGLSAINLIVESRRKQEMQDGPGNIIQASECRTTDKSANVRYFELYCYYAWFQTFNFFIVAGSRWGLRLRPPL